MSSTPTLVRRRPNHRRLSTPSRPPRPHRLSFCQPLPPSLEALDLSSASPTQTLASLRFLVLSYLAEIELRLSYIGGEEHSELPITDQSNTIDDVRDWARTTLDMLDSIRADVCSHLPEFGLPDITVEKLRSHLPDLPEVPSITSHLPDFDFDFDDFDLRNKLDDVRTRFNDLDFHQPLEFIPTLSARLQTLQSHMSTIELPQLGQTGGGTLHSLHLLLHDLVDSLLSSELVTDILNSAPDKGLKLKESLKESEEMLERAAKEVAYAVKRSFEGVKLISYSDLPQEWKNNPFVTQGYRFIPIERWHLIVLSLFALHNETLNIHTHLVPFSVWLFKSVPCGSADADLPEILFMSFALLCLLSSAIWHTMSGCAHLSSMEFCARVDYVGIGWLISASVGTIVHYGFQDCHPTLHKSFLALCFATGLAGNIFPFMKWFNEYQYRGYRVLFFLSLAFSSLAPLAALAYTQSIREMFEFIKPVIPSLLSYIIGLVFYVSHVPERYLPEDWRRRLDTFGGGSHCIWHCFIVLAVSQHKAAIRAMRDGMVCYA
ncbi:izh family channel protein [Moniliophthora roreri MCA 2997]|uniref:Izh family channel protein n=1 Tax=Moniliophthora roreri (strain MCA 2997) TaxID=1381753 RepID=V2XM45_MONRO|nr:izh family channel protein [Moniliophthora roreri MCA 2997]